MADVNRVELTLVSIPASIFVAEEQVDSYLANGWEKAHGAGRRRAASNPPTGSTPTQNPNQNR